MLESKAISLHGSHLQSPHLQDLQSLTGSFELQSNMGAQNLFQLQLDLAEYRRAVLLTFDCNALLSCKSWHTICQEVGLQSTAGTEVMHRALCSVALHQCWVAAELSEVPAPVVHLRECKRFTGYAGYYWHRDSAHDTMRCCFAPMVTGELCETAKPHRAMHLKTNKACLQFGGNAQSVMQ